MPNLVEPNIPAAAPAAAPAVEPTGPAPAAPVEPQAGESQGESLPDEILQIPAFQALMTGQPPAVSASIKAMENRPEGEIIAQNQGPLQNAGFGFYRALSGDTGVIFNQLYIKGADLQQADKEGRLAELAPPMDEVNEAVIGAGPDNPVLGFQGVQGGPSEGAAPQPPQSGSPIPPSSGLPASSQKKITTQRLKNLQAGPPSSGARPGGGRLINSILKQPV
jgi:hypothetical protein